MKSVSRVLGAAVMAGGLLAGTLAAVNTASAAENPNCDRECLKGHVDHFLDALLAHDPGAVPVTSDYKAIYNGKPTKLGDNDIWKVIDKVAFHQYMMDTTKEQVAFMGVLVQDHKRGTFFLRLVPTANGKNIELVEMIAGTRTLDGVPGLISPNPFYNYVLPPSDRRSREELVRIADSYFEGLQIHDGSNVAISKDCRRFEDGVQTTLNPVFLPISCNFFRPFTYMDATANRIYPVVDEERGLVLGQMVIQVSQNAGPPSAASSNAEPKPEPKPEEKPQEERYRPNPLTGMVMPANEFRAKPHDTIIHELFKIVDGKITEIQTIRLDRPYGWGGGWVGERGAVSLADAPASASSSNSSSGVAGAWHVTGSANNYPIDITCTLKEAAGNKLTGSCTGQQAPMPLVVTGSQDGKSVNWGYDISFQGMDLHIVYDGQIKSGNEISGNIVVQGSPAGQFKATKG